MVTPLASRFAVLPIDDDGDTSRRIKAKSLNKKKEDQAKSQNNTTSKTTDPKKKQNKKKPDQASSSKPKPNKPKNEKKSPQEQWEQWKQKDTEFVDGHYENDLQQAMLLSKLDYEEKQEFYDQIRKTSEEEKNSSGSKKNKKSNKAQPMSLSQFNQIGEPENQHDFFNGCGGGDGPLTNGKPEADPEFFDRVKSEAKKAIQSEKAEEERKAREPHIDEMISLAQYKDRLEKCNEEILRLKEVNESLQEELKNVKTRNKKLCQILLQGEMKDKAAVLVEVDKLQKVKDELSNEVSSLVAQLEQEKSKVRALTGADGKTKDKFSQKKRVRFDSAHETTRSK